MKVTVITLYEPEAPTHLVAVVEGSVSDEDYAKVARAFRAFIEGEEGFDEDDARQIFKVEMDTYPTTKAVKEITALY